MGKKSGEKKTGPASRAKILINKSDPDTGESKDHLSSDTIPEISKVDDTSCAFILRKIVEDNEGELEIVSRDLWSLLKALLSHYPYHIFQGDPMTIGSPYEALILNWEKLEKAANDISPDEKDHQARKDLKLLLDTISSGSGDPKLDKYFKTRESNKEQNYVTFESLWTLFAPGTLVYGKPFLGQDQVFIVQDNTKTWPRVGRWASTWDLQCWTYDYDGKTFKRVALLLEFESFEGTRPISSLPYYPLDYHQEPKILKECLVKRGAKYKALCTAKPESRMFDYNGDVILGKRGFTGVTGDDGEVSLSSSYDDHVLTQEI